MSFSEVSDNRHFETQLAEDPASPGKAEDDQFMLSPDQESPGPLTERALDLHNRACDLLHDLSSTEDTLKTLFADLQDDMKTEDFKEQSLDCQINSSSYRKFLPASGHYHHW